MKVEMQNNNSNYIHPSSHSADMIDETETRKFVSKKEKEEYSDKYTKVEMNTLLSDKVDKVTGKDLFSGSYNDLINKPTIPITLPANGGNADTVNNKHSTEFVNTFFLPSPMTSIKYFKIAELNTNIAPYSNGLTLIISGISDFGNNKVGTDMLQVSTRSYVCLQVYNILDSDDSSTYGYINNPNGKTEIWTKKVIYAYPSSVAVLTSIDATYGLLLEQTQEPVGIIYVDKIKYIKTTDTIPAGAKGDKGDTGLQGIQGLRGLTGAKGDKGDKGEKGDRGDRGASGSGGGGQSVYDLVIKTQADFDTMLESSDWLGAKSVCIIGMGDESPYNATSTIIIPVSVRHIQGINNATIYWGLLFNSYDILKYSSELADNNYYINNMNFMSDGINGGKITNCKNLNNCNLEIGLNLSTNGSSDASTISGFNDCTRLTNCYCNCKSYASGADYVHSKSTGFINCSQLVNCISSCYAKAFSWDGNYGGSNATCYGFSNCVQLVNCISSCICEASNPQGYGINGCSYINGCKQGDTASTTTFLGGANTHVDTSTVAAS